MLSSIKVLFRLMKLIRPLLHIMFLTILLGSLGYLAAIAITAGGGIGIGKLLGLNLNLSLNAVFIIIAVCAVSRGILKYFEQTCGHLIAFKLLAVIRDKVFGALRRLAPAKLEGKDKGNLISIITSDIEMLEVFYAHTIAPVFIGIIVSAVLVVFLYQIHFIIAIIAFISYVIMGFILPYIMLSKNKGAAADHRKQLGGMNDFMLESLRGIRDIKIYQKGDDRLNEIAEISEKAADVQKQLRKRDIISSSLSEALVMIFGLIVMAVGTHLHSLGQISGAQLVVAVIIIISGYGPVIALANLSGSLSETIASGHRVLGILDESPQVEENTGGVVTDYKNAEFKDVTFTYTDEPILENLSLKIAEKGIVGIQGDSGSGKSTMLKLLMRFWDVDKGSVNISGIDIKDINTHSLGDISGYLTQDTMLFNDTILENLKIANKNATPEQVEDACKKAGIADFINKLPDGYNTNIGELGGKLSSGEKQRLGLARLFLADVNLILLDEPTSNLDTLNEKIILKSVLDASKEKAVILVSHRESTLSVSGDIYRLENRMLAKIK